MSKYTYPAVFHKEEEGYWVEFPDWKSFYVGGTFGVGYKEALYMAEDLLGLMCYYQEKDNLPFPAPCEPVQLKDNCSIVYINADTEEYGKLMKQAKRVKRFRTLYNARKKYWWKE